MELLSPGTVRRRLRGLSRERFVAFVAALWTARGAETRVRGDYVEASHGDRVERLRVVTRRRVPGDVDAADSADVLVLSRPASAVEGTRGFDGRIVDADDLHAMVLYAVPRSAADDLCRRFFHRPLSTTSEPTRSVIGRVPEKSAPIVVGLLGVALVVAGVLGGPLSGESASVVGAPESVGSDPAAQAETDDPPLTLTPQGDAEADGTADSEGYPPGLGPGGVVDAGVLADAHAKAVTGRSYRLTISRREYVDGQWNAYRRETVSVASPTEYRTDLDGAGDLRRADLVVSEVEAFADGETRYERRVVADEFNRTYTVEASPVRGVRNGEGRYADRAERYVEWFLSVEESEVVDVVARGDTRYYWVRLGEDPYVGIENSTGGALVDEDGVVHQIRRQYDYPDDSNVSAVVVLRYADFDTTTVQPPAWVEGDSAANRTAATSATHGNATATENATATATPVATTTTTEPSEE